MISLENSNWLYFLNHLKFTVSPLFGISKWILFCHTKLLKTISYEHIRIGFGKKMLWYIHQYAKIPVLMHLVLGLAIGSLGIRKLSTLNKVLQGKWIWRFTLENESLSKWVVAEKYEEEGGWCSCNSMGSFGVGLWKAIRSSWGNLNSKTLLKVAMAKGEVLER